MVQNVTEACMVVKVPPSESWRTGVSSGAEKRKDNFGVRLRIEGVVHCPWAGNGPALLPWGLPKAGGSFFLWPGLQGLVCVSSSLRGR